MSLSGKQEDSTMRNQQQHEEDGVEQLEDTHDDDENDGDDDQKKDVGQDDVDANLILGLRLAHELHQSKCTRSSSSSSIAEQVTLSQQVTASTEYDHHQRRRRSKCVNKRKREGLPLSVPTRVPTATNNSKLSAQDQQQQQDPLRETRGPKTGCKEMQNTASFPINDTPQQQRRRLEEQQQQLERDLRIIAGNHFQQQQTYLDEQRQQQGPSTRNNPPGTRMPSAPTSSCFPSGVNTSGNIYASIFETLARGQYQQQIASNNITQQGPLMVSPANNYMLPPGVTININAFPSSTVPPAAGLLPSSPSLGIANNMSLQQQIPLTAGQLSTYLSSTFGGMAATSSPLPKMQQRQELDTPPPTVKSLHLPSFDTNFLSDYQILLRKQLEVFEAQDKDLEVNAQGRKQKLFHGQVGLRCKHCVVTSNDARVKGSVYYPKYLSGVYQAAQNMSKSHFRNSCPNIDPIIKAELNLLHNQKTRACGGKGFWAEGAKALGLIEAEDGLRIRRGS